MREVLLGGGDSVIHEESDALCLFLKIKCNVC